MKAVRGPNFSSTPMKSYPAGGALPKVKVIKEADEDLSSDSCDLDEDEVNEFYF